MQIELLPDCRAKVSRNRVFTPMGAFVPVFCANCGCDGGMVPEENMTFIFYQCQKCSDRLGDIAGTMKMPDEVFFEKVKQEQIASHGRFLTPMEIAAIVEKNDTPLATLLLKG